MAMSNPDAVDTIRYAPLGCEDEIRDGLGRWVWESQAAVVGREGGDEG